MNGNNAVYVEKEWDDQASAWKLQSRDSFSFNANGDVVRQLTQNRTFNTWTTIRQIILDYNANGDRTLLMTLQPDGSGGWDTLLRQTNVFTGKKLDTFVHQDVNTGWQYPILIIGYHLTPANSIYIYLSKNANGGWDSTARTLTTYNSNGNRIVDSSQSMDAQTGLWSTSYILYYTYNSNGDPVEYRQQLPDATSPGTFVNFGKEVYTYNSFNQRTGRTIYSWDQSSGQWIIGPGDEQYLYYYQTYVVGLPGITKPQKSLSIYPNPANNYIMVEGAGVAAYRILNTSGQLMQSGIANNIINVQQLPAGNYLIDMGQGNAQRFIKQ